MKYENESIRSNTLSSAFKGQVQLNWVKFTWVTGIYLIAIIGGYLTISWDAFILFLVFTAFTLCFGHSLGMHRKLIHQSYNCPKWLEYFMVHLGTIVGLAGPRSMLKTHDTRDWAQRQKQCHGYFGHQQSMLKDWYWQLFCDFKFDHEPTFIPSKQFQQDRVYHWMEQTWILQQMPWAVLFYYFGGISWVIWGIFVRVAVSITGHWLIGYFAHNSGTQRWHVEGADVQGFNIKFASLITMGESHHNNHHAFPNSALFAINKGELDPGWWVLKSLEKSGLVSDLVTPDELPERSDIIELDR